MNIFVTDNDPRVCAQALDNQRVNKMITESLQMLTTAMHVHQCPPELLPQTKRGTPMKPTHVNHPCTIWARTTRANYLWLVQHLEALTAEFEHRYGHAHHAASQLRAATDGARWVPEGELQAFQNSSLFKDRPVFAAYQATLATKWMKPSRVAPAWKNRTAPAWRQEASTTAARWS